MKSPCKECAYRAAGCHAFCLNYKQYRDKLDAIAKKRHLEKPIKEMAIDHTIKNEKFRKSIQK